LTIFIDYFKKWEPAMRYFNCSLQGFSDITDALKKVDSFLSEPANKFEVKLPIQKAYDTVEQLYALKAKLR
jgi:anionic cell wall polymer biosynthesis LytR-Cps2A-Psr (LCP) family protein